MYTCKICKQCHSECVITTLIAVTMDLSWRRKAGSVSCLPGLTPQCPLLSVLRASTTPKVEGQLSEYVSLLYCMLICQTVHHFQVQIQKNMKGGSWEKILTIYHVNRPIWHTFWEIFPKFWLQKGDLDPHPDLHLIFLYARLRTCRIMVWALSVRP